MRASNRESIEDFGEDDMPCPCTVCSEWFDLNDGKEHPRKENHVICASCADAIQIEIDREEEIEELQSSISDAEYTIKDAQKRLKELGVPIEGVEREQFRIEDMKDAFFAGMDHESVKHFGTITQYNRTKFEQWLATRK